MNFVTPDQLFNARMGHDIRFGSEPEPCVSGSSSVGGDGPPAAAGHTHNVLMPVSSGPPSMAAPVDGTFYFDSEANTLYVRVGGTWLPVGSSAPPEETYIHVGPTITPGDPYELELPSGHLWIVSIRGVWSGIDGLTGTFSSSLDPDGPEGESSESADSKLLARHTPGRREHSFTYYSFGPSTISVNAQDTDSDGGGVGSPTFECSIKAAWVRAAVPTDPPNPVV